MVALGRRGDAIGQGPEGQRVFVALGVPGDRVLARAQGRRHRIESILEPSPERVEPPCPLVARCGGCPWMPASLSVQREAKREALASMVARLGSEAEAELHHDGDLAYRRRARVHVSSGQVGFRARGGRAIVDVARCAVLDPIAQRGLDVVRALPIAGAAEVAIGARDDAPVLRVDTHSAQSALYGALRELVDAGRIAGAELVVEGGAPARFGASDERHEGVDGLPLQAKGLGFAQAHGALNHALVRAASSAVLAGDEPPDVLELFAGSGNFGVVVAAGAQAYTAVELDADAGAALRANLAARELAGSVVTAAADDYPKRRHDVVLLDPPRIGAAASVPRIVATAPPRVVYVSCDLSTLERDARVLLDGGYTLRRAEAFDMFPHTPHVEALTVFERV